MIERVALKVKIGLGLEDFIYPAFDVLPCVVNSGIEVNPKQKKWTKYVDFYGEGWALDKVSPHEDHDPAGGSPRGVTFGLLLMEPQFAQEALAEFPDEVTELNAAEVKTFWETRVVGLQPSQVIDTGILRGIKAQLDLDIPLTPEQERMLDPDDPMPGIRTNPRKKWTDVKKRRNIKIVKAKKPPTS